MRIFKRTERYEKVEQQEAFLREINRLLKPNEETYTKNLIAPEHPILFLVGTPRSGSTFTAQFIPSVLSIGYVSNLMARFYETPSVGARLQAMLLDPPLCGPEFQSEYGYTREIESTHEFGYFWSRWLPFGETHQVDPQQLATLDTTKMLRELAGLASVFKSPVLFKNITCSLQINFLFNTIPTAAFIDLVRSPLCTAESILQARQAASGSITDWWSLRPAEYIWLKNLDPFEQIAGQILCTRRQIESQLKVLPSERVIRLTYEDVCSRSNAVVDLISERLAALGSPVERLRTIHTPFNFRDTCRPLPHKKTFEQAFARIEARLSRESSG